MILRMLATWAVAALLLATAVTLSVRILAHPIVGLPIDSVTVLAMLFGLLATFWLVAGTLANFPSWGVCLRSGGYPGQAGRYLPGSARCTATMGILLC